MYSLGIDALAMCKYFLGKAVGAPEMVYCDSERTFLLHCDVCYYGGVISLGKCTHQGAAAPQERQTYLSWKFTAL